MTQVAIVKLSCPSEVTEVAVAELLTQYEEMPVAKMLVDQKEWQVHVPQVMTSVFGLTVYGASMAISAHLRKFHANSII
jgi:DNA-directed RNA polymerase